MSTVGNIGETNAILNINTFQITKTELYVPLITLNTKDNKKLSDLLRKAKISFWNEYKSKIEAHTEDSNNLKRILLDSSFMVINRLFVLAYTNDGNGRIYMKSSRTYALARVNLAKPNVLIDGRNFYDQPISDKITKYEELIKLTTGKGEDYTTSCLLTINTTKIAIQ